MSRNRGRGRGRDEERKRARLIFVYFSRRTCSKAGQCLQYWPCICAKLDGQTQTDSSTLVRVFASLVGEPKQANKHTQSGQLQPPLLLLRSPLLHRHLFLSLVRQRTFEAKLSYAKRPCMFDSRREQALVLVSATLSGQLGVFGFTTRSSLRYCFHFQQFAIRKSQLAIRSSIKRKTREKL